MNMTTPVIIATSSAAVIIPIIIKRSLWTDRWVARDLDQFCAIFFRGCVSCFTLRASLILKGTIKDLYKRLIMKAVAAPVGAPWMCQELAAGVMGHVSF